MIEFGRYTGRELQNRIRNTTSAISTISLRVDSERAIETIGILGSRISDISEELKRRSIEPPKPYDGSVFKYTTPDGRRTDGYHARLLNYIKEGELKGFIPVDSIVERIFGNESPFLKQQIHSIVKRTNEFLDLEGKTLEKIFTPKKAGKKQSIAGYYLTTKKISEEAKPQLPEPEAPQSIKKPPTFTKDTIQVVEFEEPTLISRVEKVHSKERFRETFLSTSVTETDTLIKTLTTDALSIDPFVSSLELYHIIDEYLPFSIHIEKRRTALQAISSTDQDTSHAGRRVIMYLDRKAILNAFRFFVTEDTERNNELFQEILTSLYERVGTFNTATNSYRDIYYFVRTNAGTVVSIWEQIPREWTRHENYQRVREILDEAVQKRRFMDDDTFFKELGADLISLGLSEESIAEYFLFLKNFSNVSPSQISSDGNPDEKVIEGAMIDDVRKVLGALTEREREVLSLRFGLEDGVERTLEEIGQEVGVTRERIRQIEAGVVRDLRKSQRARKLRGYIDEEDDLFRFRYYTERDQRNQENIPLRNVEKSEATERQSLKNDYAKAIVLKAEVPQAVLETIKARFGNRRIYELSLSREAFGSLWKEGFFDVGEVTDLIKKDGFNTYCRRTNSFGVRYTSTELLLYYSELLENLWHLYSQYSQVMDGAIPNSEIKKNITALKRAQEILIYNQ